MSSSKKKKQKNISKKYEWLLTETSLSQDVLQTFSEIFNDFIISCYFASLTIMSENNDSFVPEMDLIIFFQKYEKFINNKNYNKEELITFFSKKIVDLTNNNTKIIQVIVQKCNVFNTIVNIINK